MRTDLLKSLLGIPTYTGMEKGVIRFLMDHAAAHGYEYETDATGNVYMTKGKPGPGDFYPLVCAHTDSVHPPQDMEIVQDGDTLYAVNPTSREQIGCGGDDKSGVFICLELLAAMPVLKAAFFWGEEMYCKGSHAAESLFFEDVGYCLEFDSPQADIVSYSCDGVQLFEENGEFAKIAIPILDAHGMDKWQRHPYTDVAVLKRRFDFTCINLPAGYYYMHSKHEIVNMTDVANSIVAGKKVLEALGHKQYMFAKRRDYAAETSRKTTGLVLKYYGH